MLHPILDNTGQQNWAKTVIKGRPNFGFGAERVDFKTFGVLSVSAESSRGSFCNILVLAAVTPNFNWHH